MLLPLLGAAALSTGVWDTVKWTTPTSEPGTNQAKQPVVSGGMPIGNGETTALVFPVSKAFNTSSGFSVPVGVHLLLSMTTAMASDTELFPLALVTIETHPPLGTDDFCQTLHLSNGSVCVSTSVGSVNAWVDASTNHVLARVRGAAGPLSANVTVHSLRPSERFTYGARCSSPTSNPDNLTRIDVLGVRDGVALFHRNEDEDIAFLNKPAAFNTTLRQQGLGELIDSLQSVDVWRNRAFGLLMSGRGFGASPTQSTSRSSIVTEKAADELVVSITTHAEQVESGDAWLRETARMHRAHRRASHNGPSVDVAERRHDAAWATFWDRSHIHVSGGAVGVASLTERYAQARYVHAIQSGTWVPIKFNGMVFTGQLPPETPESGPSFRDWGADNWWQNTRLAYWPMLPAADFDRLDGLFEYYLKQLPLLLRRTEVVFNHTGAFVTETKTLFGTYATCDYGTAASDRNRSRPSYLPPGYEENPYLRFDFGGDAGLTELCVMLLDRYLYTLDEGALRRHLPLLTATLDFFAHHYGEVGKPLTAPTGDPAKKNGSATLTIFPAQALETWQCKVLPATRDNCPTNDAPTIAALLVLTERALELPGRFTTKEQRTQWTALRAALPPLPYTTDETGAKVVSPYETFDIPGTQHEANVETAELYSTHPFRLITLGRHLTHPDKCDLAPSIRCLESAKRPSTCRNADANTGWTQGILNAALLGRAKRAAAMVVERARDPPANGYRFPAFAAHYQDYQPSEDHLANMMSALQLMLLASADDGLDAGGILLFPAWPCHWDVDFKLAAPHNTTVSGIFAGGKLTSLRVLPPERKAAVRVLPCQEIEQAQR
jgi:hypothetical protein